MPQRALLLLLLAAAGCDPNVVDAVRDPLPTPMPMPTTTPVVVSPLESSLIHRYSFDGNDTTVLDSKGAAHGQLLGTKLPGNGTLPLAGDRSGQYVNLPNGIVSGLDDATFEAWVTWNGGGAWQRIFDFGNSSLGEDAPGPSGTSYLFMTPAAASDAPRMLPPSLRVAYSHNGVNDEDICHAPGTFPTGVESHVALVVDHDAASMTLYLDGALIVECPLARRLSEIDDVNNWLGHSNYSADGDLSGIYDEFRIYGAALTDQQIADSFAAGPDAQ